MGVYINMEMPTRCGRCDMCIPVFDDGMFDHYECCITAAIIDNLGEKTEDCPLVPVPPHGDLIDRKVAFDYWLCASWDFLWSPTDENIKKVLAATPTIIQAEEGE